MNKAYSRINWQNQPSTSTALGATNLNKMDIALNSIDDRVITLDTTKLDLTTANSMVKSFSLDQSTGVITITLLDGTVTTYDTKLEKLAVNFAYDATAQRLVITLDDGTKQYVDMSALITQYEFKDSSTVGFSVDGSGKVSANVKKGSITPEQLEPNYLAEITTQQQTATAQAKLSKRYAVGGVETGDTTDNAKYYKEQAELFKTQAKQYRDEAQDISNVGIAAESTIGLVKGNGNVAVQSDGSMWANPYKDLDVQTGTFITTNKADDALAQINAKGITTAIPTNPDLPISPDNKLNLISPLNFDLVSCKDNILPFMATTRTHGGVTYTVNSDNTITASGTRTGTSFIAIIGNISGNEVVFTFRKGITYYSPLSSINYRTKSGAYGGITKGTSFTPDEDLECVAIYIETQANTVLPTTLYPFLTIDKNLKTYTPYKEDKINIPYDMGEWNEIKNGEYIKGAETVVYDGSADENWTITLASSETAKTVRFDLPNAIPNSTNGNLDTMFCDYFKVTVNTDNSDIEHVRGSSSPDHVNTIAIWVNKSRLTGWNESLNNTQKITLLRTLLQANNFKIRYKLAIKFYTPLNTYLKTFKDTTNIFTTANPQVELTATFKSQLWADSYLKDNAINSKFDKDRIVNNFLATDPTTALSGAMGRLLNDKITELQNTTSIMDARGTNKNASAYRTQRKTLEFNLSTDIGLPVADTWQCIVETDLPWIDLTGTPIQKAYGYDTSGVYREFVRNCGYNDDWGAWLLNNDLTISARQNLPLSVSNSIGTIDFIKNGKTVQITSNLFQFSGQTINAWASITVGVLPVGYRPVMEVSGVPMFIHTLGDKLLLSIGIDGAVKLEALETSVTLNTGMALRFGCTFVVR